MPRDFLGNEITVGSTVVHPMRRGSKMWLATLKVDCIYDLGSNQYLLRGYNATGRRTRTRNLQLCVVK